MIIIGVVIALLLLIIVGLLLFTFIIQPKSALYPNDLEELKIEDKDEIISIGEGKIVIDKSTLKGSVNKSVFDKKEKVYTISGHVKNNSDQKYSALDLEFKLYNSSNIVLGIAIANISNISAGETWKFKADGYEDINDIKSFELSRVTQYSNLDLEK